MAGVYVRGVIKPYGCTFCPWCQTTYSFCKAANKNISVLEMNKGPDWCPLVEVPDHGDLIDRDALRIICGGRTNGKMFFSKLLKNAPVVIPAERNEDE